jgi:RNA polymerase sigma-70 factor (ECF subfamily)
VADDPGDGREPGRGPGQGHGDERGHGQDFDVFYAAAYRRLVGQVYAVTGSLAEAEDAVQEAFVSAWRRLPEFRRDAAFGTWMYRIVTNRCLNQIRSRRPTADWDAVPEPAAPESQSSPARAAESSAAVQALTRVLAELPPEQRACWILRELHGLSYEDIAEAVGASQTTVRGRIYRVRRYLTEAMGAWR